MRDSLGLRVAALPLWLPGPAETGLERGWRGGVRKHPSTPPAPTPSRLSLKRRTFFLFVYLRLEFGTEGNNMF